MLTRAGWDARGMVELFEIIRKEADRDPMKVEVLLSSHPSPRDRIAALQADVARRRGGRRDTSRFQSVKARLLKMNVPEVRAADSPAALIDGIINHCRYPLHTGLLEGINNKIKVLKRMAYGYRDDAYFFLKIRAAFPGIP